MIRHGKLSDERYEEIKEEVTYMYEETKIDTYPINPFKIAKKLYYILHPYSTLDGDEYLDAIEESDEGFSKVEWDSAMRMYRYVIYYNDIERSIRNIRWTIFHEIGHCFLGHHDNPTGNERQKEDEANFFAKYAMCPPPLLERSGCKSPQDVYAKFGASVEFSGYAFSYFMKWLHYGPRDYLPYEIKMLRMFRLVVA